MCWTRTASGALVAIALSVGPGPAAGDAPGTRAVERQDKTLRIGIVADAGPQGAALVAGAERAATEMNATQRASRLELYTVRPSRSWQDGASTLARLAFTQDLAILVGAPDAAAAHAAAQIATAKRIPFVTVSPEDGLTRVFDPWIFRGVPADVEQAQAVLRWAFLEPAGHRVTLFVPPGRSGRERSAALEEACAELGVEVVSRVAVASDGSGDLAGGPGGRPSNPTRDGGWVGPERVASVSAGFGELAAADAVLLWLDPAPARAAIERLRKTAFHGPVLGSTRLDDPEFRIAAEGVALPHFGPGQPDASHVLNRLGYALIRSVAAAAESADSPADLRRALAQGRALLPLRFDSHGNRVGGIRVGIVRNGVIHTTPSRKRGPP